MNEEKNTVETADLENNAETEEIKPVKKTLIQELVEWVKLFAFWIVVFTIITKFIVHPIQIVGNSMYPTLIDQSRGFSSIISRNSEIERLDIVVVEAKDNPDDFWVKRVIGLPGETVECIDGVVYIDGKPLEEDFLDKDYVESEEEIYGYFTYDFDAVELDDDEYFVMGDNRTHSTDSRVVGPFEKDEIKSVHVLIFYPFEYFGVK